MKVGAINRSTGLTKSIIKSVEHKISVEPAFFERGTDIIKLSNGKTLEIKTDYFLNKKQTKIFTLKDEQGSTEKTLKRFFIDGKRLKFQNDSLIAYGLLIATLTGVISMFIDYPFLTSAFSHLNWPIVGEFEVASAIAFDLGVFLVVVGSTVLILVQLGQLSKNSHNITKKLEEKKDKN